MRAREDWGASHGGRINHYSFILVLQLLKFGCIFPEIFLLCVEHMVEFKINRDEREGSDSNADHYRVNPRDFFIPTLVVQEGHSVLIFRSSRKGCESTAKHVAKYLKKFCVNSVNGETEYPDIASSIDALKKSLAGLDPETISSGVAYHLAGLTVEEREIVENCYCKGLVRVLTATSPLAAGVNLPAWRVIFRQPRIDWDFIDGT